MIVVKNASRNDIPLSLLRPVVGREGSANDYTCNIIQNKGYDMMKYPIICLKF